MTYVGRLTRFVLQGAAAPSNTATSRTTSGPRSPPSAATLVDAGPPRTGLSPSRHVPSIPLASFTRLSPLWEGDLFATIPRRKGRSSLTHPSSPALSVRWADADPFAAALVPVRQTSQLPLRVLPSGVDHLACVSRVPLNMIEYLPLIPASLASDFTQTT